jgi:pimeloyl-ACP methyl ester carboxylesterase
VEEKTVSVRNGMFEIKLRTDGQGAPLLFLHGAGGLRGWDPFLAELAQQFTVYAPAHPGFETSTGIDHIDDVLDLVIYYNDFLDALGLESVHVVGHSMGGMIGAEIAALSPHRVRKRAGKHRGIVAGRASGGRLLRHDTESARRALWHDPRSEVAKAVMAVLQDEKAGSKYCSSQSTSGGGRQVLAHSVRPEKTPASVSADPDSLRQSDGLVPLCPRISAHCGAQMSICFCCGHMPMYEDTAGFDYRHFPQG